MEKKTTSKSGKRLLCCARNKGNGLKCRRVATIGAEVKGSDMYCTQHYKSIILPSQEQEPEENDEQEENKEEEEEEKEEKEEEKNVNIVLTVPHAVCIQTRRDCDRKAEEAARRLYKHLIKRVSIKEKKKRRRRIKVHLFVSDLYRPIVDANRASARWTTTFRQRIRNVDAGLLIDIHSYPKHSVWIEEKHGDDDDDDDNQPEMVVLDNEPDAPTPWVTEMVSFLRRKGVRIYHLVGSIENDIVREARNRGIPAVLLEFYECLSATRLDTITTFIANFFLP